MSEPAPITIAVVSWNTRALLRRCLRSFEHASERGLCEVWVCDNASTDGSAAMVAEEFGWTRLISSDKNLGFGPAINEIARRSGGEWIAAANADVELRQGALEAMLEAGADPEVGAVAPRLHTAAGSTQHSVHPFPTPTLALVVALGLYRLPGVGERLCIEGYWDPARPRTVDWAHGAFLLIRRQAFERIGGFDQRQWLYAEDIDIQWRLSRGGLRTLYEPAAELAHAVSAAATEAFGQQRTARHIRATYAWQARAQGGVAAWSSALINGLGSAVRWWWFALVARLGGDRSRADRDRLAALTRIHLSALRRRRALERSIERPRSLA